jgi:transcriptional regulator with XRE-family HTH domain
MIKIGDKLRNLRLKNNLTQAELGNRCNLTKGFISQLEADLTSPSLSTLDDILQCLGTSFKGFFSDTQEEKIIYKSEDVIIKDFEDEGYKIHWLVSDAQKNEMEPIMLVLNSGCQTELDVPHEGEEFGYVISGSITLNMGARSYKVKKGESFYFQPKTPHYIKNTAKTPARVLWVSSPPTF